MNFEQPDPGRKSLRRLMTEYHGAIYPLLGCETRLHMAVEKDTCQDLAWYREEGNPPVVVTLLVVTLTLPDRNDNAPSPVGREVHRGPNETTECVTTEGR